MNRKQKTAVVIGTLAVVALALFPPHTAVSNQGTETRIRFTWLFGPQRDAQSTFRYTDSRLPGLQLAVLTLTIAAVVLLADRKRAPVAETFD